MKLAFFARIKLLNSALIGSMKKFGIVLLLLIIMGELRSAYMIRSEWPFHAMDMFSGKGATSVHKLKIVTIDINDNEFLITPQQVLPFGFWRFRINILKKNINGQESLNTFLSQFYLYKKKSASEIYSEIKGIRVYRCKSLNKTECTLLGQSDIPSASISTD